MWVHVKNVPLKMFSWQGLSYVTSPLGVPTRLHPETAQCLNLEVAKIFVKVDLTKDLPKKMNFKVQGEDILVEYVYPWLPTKCVKCDKWGHSVKACPKVREELSEERIAMEGNNSKEEKDNEKEVSGEVMKVIATEEIKVQKDNLEEGMAETKSQQENINQKEEKKEKEKEWSYVSPGKNCQSPESRKILEFGSVSILTKSRFEVLAEEEEGETAEVESEKEEETELEVEDLGEEVEEKEEIEIPRQSLPRDSKANHRYLRSKTGQRAQDADPSYLNKKKPRRN